MNVEWGAGRRDGGVGALGSVVVGRRLALGGPVQSMGKRR
jgi:hypothetical protein